MPNGTDYQSNPILQQLESLGLTGQDNWWQYAPEDIMQAVGTTYGMDDDTLEKMNPAMFAGFTPQQYAMSQQDYYNPMLLGGQKSFLDEYVRKSGVAGSKFAGGFAGTSAFGGAMGGLRDEYGRNVGELVGQVTQQKQQSVANVLKQIQDWKTTGRTIRYGT